MDNLLTVPEAAKRFNTPERFVRRLIAERRITVVRLGRYVRIPESAISEFIQAGTVQLFTMRRLERHLKVVS